MGTYERLNKVVWPEETGTCLFDTHGHIRFHDDNFFVLSGGTASASTTFYTWLTHFLDEEGREQVTMIFDRLTQGEIDREAIECVSGAGRHVLLQMARGETLDDDRPLIHAHLKDMTYEKKVKTDLLIGTLVEHVSQPMCVFLLGGDILSVNPAMCDLYGQSREVIEKGNFYDMVDLTYDEFRKMKVEEGRSRRLYDRTLFLPKKYNIPVEIFVGSYNLDVSTTPVFYAFITDHRLFQEHEALKRQLSLVSRQRSISRDLHDNVAQTLALVKMRFEKVLPHLGEELLPETTGDVVACMKLLDEAQTEMRAVIRHLREETTVRVEDCLWSIEEVLRYAHDMLGLEIIDMGVALLSRLDERVSAELNQLLREALTNVHKHAGNNLVWLSVMQDGDHLLVKVTDRGKGFDVSKKRDGHYGLAIMEERLKKLGGDVVITSTPKKGTDVTFKLPCPEL